MFRNKCPKCKSSNIIDQRWIYSFAPNSCKECDFQWEATIFIRLFFAVWILGLGAATITNIAKSEFFKSDSGAVVAFTYLGLLFLAPIISQRIAPFKIWGGSVMARKVVNFTCMGLIALFVVLYYVNA